MYFHYFISYKTKTIWLIVSYKFIIICPGLTGYKTCYFINYLTLFENKKLKS